MSCHIIPFELPLQPALPTIEGNVDYRQWRDQLHHIDALLLQSGVETQFLQSSLQDWLNQAQTDGSSVSTKDQLRFQERTLRALRCNQGPLI